MNRILLSLVIYIATMNIPFIKKIAENNPWLWRLAETAILSWIWVILWLIQQAIQNWGDINWDIILWAWLTAAFTSITMWLQKRSRDRLEDLKEDK